MLSGTPKLVESRRSGLAAIHAVIENVPNFEK